MKKIFNPNGKDSKADRQIFGGDATGIINLNNVKYEWAVKLWKQMRDNFWQPYKFDLSLDVVQYNELTPTERRAFDGILSFLVYLDSVQVNNVPQLMSRVTASEVVLCLGEQIAQEGLHGQTYQYMIETILESLGKNYIYDYWRNDKVLLDRCTFIASTYQDFLDDPTDEKYAKSLVGDLALEGLYFYQGFIVFYAFTSRGLMGGSSDLIKLIHRDELSHVRLYEILVKEAIDYYGLNKQWVYDYFTEAVKQEIAWNQYIIGEDFLGITPTSIEEYTKYLANARLKNIGLEPIFEGAYNRYKHLEKIADNSNEATTRGNFFDSNMTSYVMSNAVDGFDEI